MEFRHPPPPLRKNEEHSYSTTPQQGCRINQNFSVPPPPIVQQCNAPPPPFQTFHTEYNAPPIAYCAAWGPNGGGNYVPSHLQPKLFTDAPQYSAVSGPSDGFQSSLNYWAKPDACYLYEKDDEVWTKEYIQSILGNSRNKFIKNDGMPNRMSIFEARVCLQECQGLLQDLEHLKKDVRENMDKLNQEEWSEKCGLIESKKLCLRKYLDKLSSPSLMHSLTKAITKRRKKRETLKKRRANQKETKALAAKRREQLHLSIDTWLEKMQQSVEKVKVEESLKVQADAVLSDVTRKKTEARRQLSLLSMLLKLRKVRVQTAANRGEHSSIEMSKIFENVVVKLQHYWTDQLKEYNLEEKGLQVMLEEATEDTSKDTKSVLQRTLMDWQRVIFGRKISNDEFFLAAERDIDAFVAIRHQWDNFVVTSDAPMSSTIPVGWVLPVKPSTDQWEQLLQTNAPGN